MIRLGQTGQRAAAALESVAGTLRWAALGGMLLFALWLLSDVCLLVFAAVLVASVLRGASDWVASTFHLRPGWSLILATVFVVALAGGLVWWRGPVIIDEASQLEEQLRDQLGNLRQIVEGTSSGRAAAGHLGRYLSGSGEAIAGAMAGVATSTLGVLGSLLVLLVTALYFAISPELYVGGTLRLLHVGGTLRLLPPRMRERGADVLQATGGTLRWWFAGQAVDMLVVGLLSWAGLAALGVPLAPTLALIAGLLNFVPFIGALAGAVPAVLVALGQGMDQALSVALLFLAVQTLEGNVIAPLIQRRTVRLPPALTILSQTVLGTLFGPMGLILATPLAAAGMVVVRMVYVESVLEHGEDRRETD
jgi:predicted PurR-regulated permease PerM